MSKIVIDARVINTTTGTYIERLLHYLQIIDLTNDYIVLIPSADQDFWKPTNPKWQVKFADFANYSLAEQIGFKTYLKSLNPDLVHFCMPQQPVGYHGKKVTTFHDLTLIRTSHSDKNWFLFSLKQLVGRWVFKRVAQTSEAILVPTEYTKQDLLNFVAINPDKITVTYESADIGIYELAPYEIPFKDFLVNVGRQTDHKNVVRLAEAHQQLLTKHPDLGLVFINGPDEALLNNQKLFEERGYKNIHFTYAISKGQRDYIYQRATAYVTPSLSEGFGLTGLEAMGFGIPTLSSNSTCLPEVYGDGALYFDPLDVNDIADKIDAVLSNQELCQNLVKRGIARHRWFSWERMAKQTLAVYNQVLKQD